MHLAGISVVSHAKITNAVARIHFERQQWLEIGTLEERRDWGYAKEYTGSTCSAGSLKPRSKSYAG